MNGFPIISLLTLLPILGGVFVICLGGENRKAARGIGLASAGLSLGLALVMWKMFDASSGGFRFEERHEWIKSLGIDYRVAVDGLGLLMVLLAAVVTLMAMAASGYLFAGAGQPPGNAGPGAHIYYALILFLQAGLFGTFTALNFFHWFLFWELSLIPAFFLVRLWGGPARASAATQFFVYTMVGSVGL